MQETNKTRNGPPGNRGVQKEKKGTDSVSLEERKAAARSSCCAPDFITGRDASSQQVTLHIWYQLALTATVIASRSDKVNYPRCMRVFLMDQTHNAMLSIVKERDANVFVHHCQSPFLNYNTSHRRTAGGLGQWVGRRRPGICGKQNTIRRPESDPPVTEMPKLSRYSCHLSVSRPTDVTSDGGISAQRARA